MTLEYNVKGAQSGRADSLVIFLHGYGADGKDLLGLADPMAPHLPNADFVAPDAPYTCTVNPMGHEWFPIPWIDGSDPVTAGRTMQEAFAALDAWVTEIIVERKVSADRTILVGFSQGTMMSLHVGPRRADALAGIVGFSGRLLEAGALTTEIKSKPPVQLIHGDQDDVVPYTDMAKAEAGLKTAGIDVRSFTSTGTAHGIAPDGLGVAVQFISECLAKG